jgi:hypothetical protein
MELFQARKSGIVKFDSFEKQQISGHKGSLQQRLKRWLLDPHYAIAGRIVRCGIGIDDYRHAAIIRFVTLDRHNIAKYSFERFRCGHRLYRDVHILFLLIPHRQMGVKETLARLLKALSQRIHSLPPACEPASQKTQNDQH